MSLELQPEITRAETGPGVVTLVWNDGRFVWHDADFQRYPLRLEEPPDEWDGEEGLVDRDVIARHLGAETRDFQHFLCGPPQMTEAARGHLLDLGVDLVEVMPVNAFNGTHNWGYDGVGWFAVSESYDGPDAYRRFVDACHAKGLGVVQDVVYNHLGPSGNYLPRFGPYLRDGSANTWGDSVAVDTPEVRRFILDNLAMWFDDFHVDGLRLDAVHDQA